MDSSSGCCTPLRLFYHFYGNSNCTHSDRTDVHRFLFFFSFCLFTYSLRQYFSVSFGAFCQAWHALGHKSFLTVHTREYYPELDVLTRRLDHLVTLSCRPPPCLGCWARRAEQMNIRSEHPHTWHKKSANVPNVFLFGSRENIKLIPGLMWESKYNRETLLSSPRKEKKGGKKVNIWTPSVSFPIVHTHTSLDTFLIPSFDNHPFWFWLSKYVCTLHEEWNRLYTTIPNLNKKKKKYQFFPITFWRIFTIVRRKMKKRSTEIACCKFFSFHFRLVTHFRGNETKL